METERLIIRESVWEDIEIFHKWEQMPEVTEFFSIRDGQTKEDVIRKFVADDNNPQSKQLTIILKETGKPIGRIVLGDIEDGWKAEIWRIYIGELELRGKGLGKEAMKAMMKYCFEELGLERVYLDHYTGNPASYLYLSLGFKYEGVLRKNCRKNGILYDVHLMSMLKEEYIELYK
ncbi:MAG: GNAT family N-acetyltransferase [Firmicutes bacterium]|nr:GNAT family N-acetyltransferase [Bacillota bacterium]